jgi:hypothetical protein
LLLVIGVIYSSDHDWDQYYLKYHKTIGKVSKIVTITKKNEIKNSNNNDYNEIPIITYFAINVPLPSLPLLPSKLKAIISLMRDAKVSADPI